MAIIAPFRRVHYNGKSVGDLNRLITPPYDVISLAQQDAYYKAHELNIIRLVLGKQYPGDAEDNNRYTRAATTLTQWLGAGILVRDQRPGLAVYQMEFDRPDGGRRKIEGLVTLVKVDDYGKGRVLPHEKTYRGPKQDQLNLLRACHAHLTPIHALFNDSDNAVSDAYGRFMQGPPDQEAKDATGTIHRTWSLDDQDTIGKISSIFEDKSIVIADGHHRYETSLAYRNETRQDAEQESAGGPGYVMMYLTSTSHPGLTILPAHRMVKGLVGLSVQDLLQKLEPYFQAPWSDFSSEDLQHEARSIVAGMSSFSEAVGNFGMVYDREKGYRLLKLRSFEAVDSLIDSGIPPDLRELDVTILREAVMGYGLRLEREDIEGHVEYTPSAQEALEKVTAGEVQIAFLLNPTRVEQVQVAAELGHKLPHKSTYFYPKVASGLVLNVF